MKWFFVLVLIVNYLNGQNDQLFIGTRPLSMGGAFIAVADDANTITWNPAGLPGLRRTEFTSTYSDLYALGINQSYIGFVRPFSDRIAVGVDWANISFDDKELLYGENKINFALGLQAHRKFAFGLTLKYLMRDMQLDGTSYGKSSGLGYDMGFLIQPFKNVKVGIGLYDLSGTQISFKDDKKNEEILGQAFKVGISYMPINGLNFAVDYGDRLHLGIEYILASKVSFRAGLQQGIGHEKKILVPSAGISIKFKSISQLKKQINMTLCRC